jgi:RimJ/RimL family protein N-acetyltransferase
MRAIGRRLRKLAYLREEHVWYERDLRRPGPLELPRGLRLERTGLDQVELVKVFGQDVEQARSRLAAGNDIWLVLEDEQPLFLCFTFRAATPVIAAADGTLELPEGSACLEDAVTVPEARGRGIASAAWSTIGDELGRAGLSTLVAKVETDNGASRRVAEKAGLNPVAVMQHERTGVRQRTAVRPLGGRLGDELTARLS